MDVRKTQNQKRNFGAAPTAVWGAFRQRVPLREASSEAGAQMTSAVASQFLKTTAASTFYRGDAPPSGGH
jgi:hypothetical protein